MCDDTTRTVLKQHIQRPDVRCRHRRMAAAPPSAPVIPAPAAPPAVPAPATIPGELLQPIVPAVVFSTSCRVKTCTRGRRFQPAAALPNAPAVVFPSAAALCKCTRRRLPPDAVLPPPMPVIAASAAPAIVPPEVQEHQYCDRVTTPVSAVLLKFQHISVGSFVKDSPRQCQPFFFFVSPYHSYNNKFASLKTVQNDHDSYRFKYLGSYCLNKIIS